MLKQVRNHGFEFEIDTNDWDDLDDAERCSDLIETRINAWSQKLAERYHLVLLRLQADDVDWDNPDVEAVARMCGSCANVVIMDYVGGVESGHNYFVRAI